jgi:hypothetical protein
VVPLSPLEAPHGEVIWERPLAADRRPLRALLVATSGLAAGETLPSASTHVFSVLKRGHFQIPLFPNRRRLESEDNGLLSSLPQPKNNHTTSSYVSLPEASARVIPLSYTAYGIELRDIHNR